MTLLLLLACSGSMSGPTPLLDGEGFFGSPFPSDGRTVAGSPDLQGFPGQGEFDLLDTYIADVEGLQGFGTNAPIWVSFDGALDLAALPDPAGSVQDDSPLMLIDIDDRSPARGSLVPIRWSWNAEASTFQAQDLLTVQPLWGAPLHPERRYALVVRTSVARPAPGMEEVWSPEHPDHERYQPLQEVLFARGIPLEEVAVATVFTTQDPLSAVRVATAAMRARIELPRLDQRLRQVSKSTGFTAYEGFVWLPIWQHGEKPYFTEGGGFAFDEEGRAVQAGWERVAFRLSIPIGEEEGAQGWPVVIHGHGTGGDASSHMGSSMLSPANVLGRRGVAGFAVSLPLHGDRGSGADPSLVSFNYFNPAAARGNFQQAALDLVYQVDLLSAFDHRFTLEDEEGREVGSARLDPSRVAYLGHSHGGIIGAMAGPWLGDGLRAAVLSGAGGGLSLSIELREEDSIDIQALIATTFELPGPESVIADHPLIGMVQLLGEAVDPLNYAPYWSQRQPWWVNQPLPVLMTTGLLDEHTPTVTSQVLAAAGGLPILDPVSESQDINELLGLVGQEVPTSDNLLSWEGIALSGGLAEFPEADHFPIFDDSDAAKVYATFLETALFESSPLIDMPQE